MTKKAAGAAVVAAQLAQDKASEAIVAQIRSMDGDKPTAAIHAARVIDELVKLDGALLVPHIGKLVKLLSNHEARVLQTASTSLPALVRLAPAKVARHLPVLIEAYPSMPDAAKDGLVRTFAALCDASIAYQKKVIAVLEQALRDAEPKTLQRWSELALPVLKGEPYAQAREVVEGRLYDIPRPVAQKIADQLGMRLRPSTV